MNPVIGDAAGNRTSTAESALEPGGSGVVEGGVTNLFRGWGRRESNVSADPNADVAMAVTRRRVLERLAAASDAEARETTTTEALAATLDADEAAVASHLDALSACELARVDADGRARVTVTGEEALELPTEGIVVVDAPPRSED